MVFDKMKDVQKNVFLAPYTTFKIGGPSKYFYIAKNTKDLIKIIKIAKKEKIAIFILGKGSNLLISDKGYDGLVIKIKLNDIKVDINNKEIQIGAGVSLINVVRNSAENSLSGIEWAINVPGTIGGAVIINAGCFGGEMSELIKNVKVLNIDNFEIETYSKKECNFSYRSSIFKKIKNRIILSVSLKFKNSSVEKINKKIKKIISKRIQQQPQGISAGSFFKKVIVNDAKIIKIFKDKGGLKFENNKISAGWFIEQCGLKGKKIGGAIVSEKHANFIINTGQATAEDVIMLISLIKEKVRNKFNVQLQEEIEYIGF
ncbi:MAG: UDP-N-acetylmuramate dehydrogenase [Candidatus Kuenenbacteria bacterium]